MATQLRAIQSYEPTMAENVANSLEYMRDLLAERLPEAEEINFMFRSRGLMVEIKTNQREKRDAILLKLSSGVVPKISFDKIIEGVETGARRRLTVTAEVR